MRKGFIRNSIEMLYSPKYLQAFTYGIGKTQVHWEQTIFWILFKLINLSFLQSSHIPIWQQHAGSKVPSTNWSFYIQMKRNPEDKATFVSSTYWIYPVSISTRQQIKESKKQYNGYLPVPSYQEPFHRWILLSTPNIFHLLKTLLAIQ